MKPTRQQAWQILTEYTKSEALLQHALAVEGVMRHFAELAGEDPEEWGVIGLLHDLDYEQFPDQHCHKTAEILAEKGVDEKLIRAVCSHGYGICTDIEPKASWKRHSTPMTSLPG